MAFDHPIAQLAWSAATGLWEDMVRNHVLSILWKLGWMPELAAPVEWLLVGILALTIYRVAKLGPLVGERGNLYWAWAVVGGPISLAVVVVALIIHTMKRPPPRPEGKIPDPPQSEPLHPDQIRQSGGAW